MEQYYNQLITNLNGFVSDLNRYIPNEGCSKFLEVFDKLDMGKVMLRYLNSMRDHEDELKNRNEVMFTNDLIVFPNINLSEFWPNLSTGQKNKVWTYLQILYVQCELILNFKESSESSSDKNKTLKTIVENMKEAETVENEFNPYLGVGNNNTDYSVNDILSGCENIADGIHKPGLSSFAGTIGLDKMLDVDKLSDQLKNMKKEDIDQATSNIKGLLSTNIDEKTSSILDVMLSNIQEELQRDDVASGNPLDKIMKIAEKISDKIKPKIESEGLDVSKLWSSTQNLANSCTDENGKTPFTGGIDPFSLINKLMTQTQGSGSEQDQGLGQEDYIKQCNSTLQSMGLNGIDLSRFNPEAIKQMQSHMSNGQPKRTRRVKINKKK